MKTFLEAKQKFDAKYSAEDNFIAFLPVNLDLNKKVKIKGLKGVPNEEYYKWQFFYGLVYSGLYPKDFIGSEISFPKGNKSSAPIKLDGAIFDDDSWFNRYKNWIKNKDQSDLDWLRSHLIGAIEFKKEDGKNIETVYNQQLKPAIKESENDFCLGVLYDTERLFLFLKRQGKGKCIRLDEGYNLRGEDSSTKDLSLHLPDEFRKIPSLRQIQKRFINLKSDRSDRTIEDLDLIAGVFSTQINNAISNILITLDQVSMLNERGYETLLQLIALKIFDEKKDKLLKYYIQNTEHKDIRCLKFYIEQSERDFKTLNDPNIQAFIKRMKDLQTQAESAYKVILSKSIIDWKSEEFVVVAGSIVHNLQDYCFTKSSTTDIYQLVFYHFGNAFTKAKKAQFLTPIPLIEFLVDIINPRASDTIADPTVGSGDFLSLSYVKSEREIDDKNIYGVDNDKQMVMLAQLNMLLNGDGNAKIEFQPSHGSITHKFRDDGKLVRLITETAKHKAGNWDDWDDHTRLKKFDVVLTNPPFGEDRKFEPKNQEEKAVIELYELWHVARTSNWIDRGLIFLENAYRILKENGRLGIVLSNSIASIDRWEKARKWLMSKMRVVALFDLPANIFADTGVNTTILVAYKPSEEGLKRLDESGYSIFVKDIQQVGYEVRTTKRVKHFSPIYKIDNEKFEVKTDDGGKPLLDEEFTQTADEFKEWCSGQEKTLQNIFLDK